MSTVVPDRQFHLASVAVSDAAGVRALFGEVARISERNAQQLYGHTDLVDSPEALHVAHLDRDDTDRRLLVAVAGPAGGAGEEDAPGVPELAQPAGTVLGWGQASLPLRDNLHTAELFVEVDPAARRVGVGTALVRALEAQAREAGRHTLLSWTTHSEEADPADPDALTAPTGVGSLRSSDPSAAFALGHGYRLEQTERHSQLDVPVPAEVLDPLRRRAEDAAGGYRVLTWTGPTPPEHRAGMARLHQRMSVDVPTADLEIGEEVWDVERVVRSDERAVRMGRTVLTAVAQHVASGELVAYTLLFCPQEDEAVAWQGDTLVHGEHRGHRLGLLVKVANLDQLARQRPGTRRIHTWNAGENQWMLAINVALGFRRVATEGAWQKRLRS